MHSNSCSRPSISPPKTSSPAAADPSAPSSSAMAKSSPPASTRSPPTNDPTAHAEVYRHPRRLRRRLQPLSFAEPPSTPAASPAPCASPPSYWARLDALYFGCTAADAARAGFDDSFFYTQVALPTHADRPRPPLRLISCAKKPGPALQPGKASPVESTTDAPTQTAQHPPSQDRHPRHRLRHRRQLPSPNSSPALTQFPGPPPHPHLQPRHRPQAIQPRRRPRPRRHPLDREHRRRPRLRCRRHHRTHRRPRPRL